MRAAVTVAGSLKLLRVSGSRIGIGIGIGIGHGAFPSSSSSPSPLRAPVGRERPFAPRPIAGRETGTRPTTGPRMTAATRETAAQSIWEQITSRYNAAQASQASSFTETDTELYEDTSTGLSPSTLPPLSYIVKVARRLREKPKNASNKPAATREEKTKNNPFLPPDPELYVLQLTPTHSLVLNKFNITPHHVIVITDAFEEQEVPLSVADFEATWMVVRGMQGEREGVEGVEGVEGGMAFFNRGPLSGASQPHKHIQCVPLPLMNGMGSPFEGLIRAALSASSDADASATVSVDALPFMHGVRSVVDATPSDVHAACEAILDGLEARLQGMWTRDDSYNLLLTKEYLMVIPRRAEFVESVGANAMGFAGSFFLGTQAEIDDLKRLGPSRVLQGLGFPSITR